MGGAVQDYIEAISPVHRPLFDRLQGLIVQAHPDVSLELSYGMPVFKVGGNRLFVGVWKRFVSIYGWPQERDAFVSSHPELRTSKGTIQLRPDVAATITDAELRVLVRDALG